MALPEDEVKQAQKDPAEAVEVESEAVEDETAELEQAPEPAEELPVADALSKTQEEAEKFKDLALRAEAEMQNMQRRTDRAIENAHKYGVERFLQNLLPVVDSLEKAIDALEQAPGDDRREDATAEGIRLCHKLLIDVLARENVAVLDPVGEPFNPNEHQAVTTVENPDMEPNSVSDVIQKGYKLNDRLVRAAMVVVTKPLADAEPAGTSTGQQAPTE